MLLMIDNYDSFTYNLVQYFGELGQDLKVYRNNKITIPEIEKMKPGPYRHFARARALRRRPGSRST